MTTITVAGTQVEFAADWKITVPLSDVGVAPSATFTVTSSDPVGANDPVTITDGGSTLFDGTTISGGKIRGNGQREVTARHDATTLFGEDISIDLISGVTAEDVLITALVASEAGGDFTLNYGPAPPTLSSAYDVKNRSVKRIFEDMMDRSGTVWWVDPAGSTIHVQDRGGRGQWRSVDAGGTGTDDATVQRFEPGSVDSVRNDVTVVGTGGEAVEGTAQDSTSVSEYGRQAETFNVSYIISQSEANSMASELLQPDPLPSLELLAGQGVGDVRDPLVNYTVAVEDNTKGINESGLTVEQQTIRQGRATLSTGEAAGTPTRNLNRSSKSQSDTTAPGSVYNTERLANNAITQTKITDGAVITPKLAANAVVAGKIAADEITANEIDVLDLDTAQLSVGAESTDQIEFRVVQDGLGNDVVQMVPSSDQRTDLGDSSLYWRDVWVDNLNWHGGILEPAGASNSINAGAVDNGETALYPDADDTGELGGTVAGTQRAFSRMIAYEFVDADDGVLTPDGGSALSGLAEMADYPEHAQRDGGVSMNALAKWLFAVCREQQQRLERVEERLDRLEARQG